MEKDFSRETASEWADIDCVYYLEDGPSDYTGNYFEKIFRTLEEANEAARDLWERKTEKERSERCVWVGKITRDNLDLHLARDGFPIDWMTFDEVLMVEGAFNSEDFNPKGGG